MQPTGLLWLSVALHAQIILHRLLLELTCHSPDIKASSHTDIASKLCCLWTGIYFVIPYHDVVISAQSSDSSLTRVEILVHLCARFCLNCSQGGANISLLDCGPQSVITQRLQQPLSSCLPVEARLLTCSWSLRSMHMLAALGASLTCPAPRAADESSTRIQVGFLLKRVQGDSDRRTAGPAA